MAAPIIIPTGALAAAQAGPLNGPQINQDGTRAVAFWDPAPGNRSASDQPIFYGSGPLYAENPWDMVILGGKPLPGLCTIKCEPQLQIDQQKGPKHDGARLTLHGVLPSPIEIGVTIWTQEQWATFVTLVPLWWRKPEKDAASLKALASANKVSAREAQLMQAASSIFHPSLIPYGITQVIVRGPSIPEDGPVPQSKIIRIKCIEYQPPTQKTAPSKVKPAKVAADERVVTPEPPSKTHVSPNGLASG